MVNKKLKQSLGALLTLIVLLASFRFTVFTWQRNQLGSAILDASECLNKFKEAYWLNFGTLLGAVRDENVIWTDVDADISALKSVSVAITAGTHGIRDCINLKFAELERRDEFKYKMYNRFGFRVDLDVWDDTPGDSSGLTMITGVGYLFFFQIICLELILVCVPPQNLEDKEVYHLPKSILLPTQTIPFLGGDVQVPHLPIELVEYWYGPTWTVRRTYFKGRDYSRDVLEVLIATTAPIIFEFFNCIKACALGLLYGVRFALIDTFLMVACIAVTIIAPWRYLSMLKQVSAGLPMPKASASESQDDLMFALPTVDSLLVALAIALPVMLWPTIAVSNPSSTELVLLGVLFITTLWCGWLGMCSQLWMRSSGMMKWGILLAHATLALIIWVGLVSVP